jgi:agmatinase
MDVFDPSIAPGVGTPQPDGILYNDFIEALRIVASRAQLVGMDVMETRRTDSKTTEILAAKIITDFIAAREKNL